MQYKWSSESIHVNSITILPSENTAQEFMDKIYPHWAESIIVSADGVFPKDEKLKELALAKLVEDQNLPVVVFGEIYLKNLSIASNKKLIMDEYLKRDMYMYDDSESVFNWNARSIAMFCFIWVSQFGPEPRLNYVDMRNIYNPQSIRWYHNLIYKNE
jgi:hypothetical protein